MTNAQLGYRVSVLGRLDVRVHGRPVTMPVQAQRLLALLSIVPAQSRSAAAGTLWADVPERRALANLRNAVWLVRRAADSLLSCTRSSVGLGDATMLDLADARRCAHGVLGGAGADHAEVIDLLDHDLLPDWDEEWLVIERERQRQLRLHALEVHSAALSRAGCYPQAIAAALAAVRAEPLRESAQRVLIEAHVGEGNVSEGIRQLESYRQLLVEHLGIDPSPELRAVVDLALQQC